MLINKTKSVEDFCGETRGKFFEKAQPISLRHFNRLPIIITTHSSSCLISCVDNLNIQGQRPI